jgi:hypothetical protein
MKNVLLCIGAVTVLFLVIGVYTAQAQGDLRGFDGRWLQITIQEQKGLSFTMGQDSTETPGKWANRKHQLYACVDVRDKGVANEKANLRFYDSDGRAKGYGSIYWDAGTNLEFLGTISGRLAIDVTYVPGPNGLPTQESLYDLVADAYSSVKGKDIERIVIQSLGGWGWTEIPTTTETTGIYAGFGINLTGKILTGNRIPKFTITPACGEIVFP